MTALQTHLRYPTHRWLFHAMACLGVMCAAPAWAQATAPANKASPDGAGSFAKRHPLAPSSVRNSYFTCLAKNDSRVGLAQCMDDEASFQDARLDTLYKSLADALDNEQKAKLKIAQRLWLEFRKREKSFDNNLRTEPMADLAVNEHQIFLTAVRADWLESHLAVVKP